MRRRRGHGPGCGRWDGRRRRRTGGRELVRGRTGSGCGQRPRRRRCGRVSRRPSDDPPGGLGRDGDGEAEGRQRQLRRQIFRQCHRNRQLNLGLIRSGCRDGQRLRADCSIFRNIEAQFDCDACVGIRHRGSDRLAPTHQSCRPPGRHTSHRERHTLRRRTEILQMQTNGRCLARPYRDRRIVARQKQAFDVFRGVVSFHSRRKNNRESGKGGDKPVSHWYWLPGRKWFGWPPPRRARNEPGRGSEHCRRNRDKIAQTAAFLARAGQKVLR